jgi:aryl-phospho-beta-D-glucosidase BglC (GH1 family)
LNKNTIANALSPLNLGRKLAKPVVICISAIVLLSMVSMLMVNGVQAATNVQALHTEGKLIKDASGNTIYLRGLQKVELADDPDGTWNGNSMWSDANVKAELDEMKAWGANTVRCIQSVDNWKYDLNTPYASISSRDAVKRLIQFAAERDMYVIFTGYRVTNYFSGGNQDPLPYPPHQTSSGASSVITSKQDFVNWWTDVAQELKGYNNVLFEIWNEPMVSDAAAVQEYFGVQQQVITAIRGTGAQNLILAQWDMGSWVDLDSGGGSTMDWVNTAKLTDPTNNLVYVTHLYREYGQLGIYSKQESINKWGTTHAYDYNELKRAFTAEKIDYILNTLNKPMFVTECGANMDKSGAEANYEQQALANELKIFNEWGINWIVHWFREIGIFRLHTGAPNFTPTAGGTITQQYLKEQKVFPPTTTPTPTVTPTPTPSPNATVAQQPTPNTSQNLSPTITPTPPTTTPMPEQNQNQTQKPSATPNSSTELKIPTQPIPIILQPFSNLFFWRIFGFPLLNTWSFLF